MTQSLILVQLKNFKAFKEKVGKWNYINNSLKTKWGLQLVWMILPHTMKTEGPVYGLGRSVTVCNTGVHHSCHHDSAPEPVCITTNSTKDVK